MHPHKHHGLIRVRNKYHELIRVRKQVSRLRSFSNIWYKTVGPQDKRHARYKPTGPCKFQDAAGSNARGLLPFVCLVHFWCLLPFVCLVHFWCLLPVVCLVHFCACCLLCAWHIFGAFAAFCVLGTFLVLLLPFVCLVHFGAFAAFCVLGTF